MKNVVIHPRNWEPSDEQRSGALHPDLETLHLSVREAMEVRVALEAWEAEQSRIHAEEYERRMRAIYALRPQLTLGEFITKLRENALYSELVRLDTGAPIRSWTTYRGDATCLALVPGFGSGLSRSQLRIELHSAIGTEISTHKGNVCTVSAATPLWVAPDDATHTRCAVTGLVRLDRKLVITTSLVLDVREPDAP